ncbi:prolactin-8A9-like [Chionomys nivalis]|uniref:prolactin-8A9-like n=1 Tax=Chionomys nivalis TaxID=269649 RepID=UPI00259A696B|nr:prolactin-8A9-like [Chionomys nivalis]
MKLALCHRSSSARADGWTARLEARTESETNREKHFRERQDFLRHLPEKNNTAQKDNVLYLGKLEIINIVKSVCPIRLISRQKKQNFDPVYWTLLLLLVSSLLIWEKAASIPECHTKEGGCWDPLVETFNSAIKRAETIRDVAEQMHQEFLELMVKRFPPVVSARLNCHSNATVHPDLGAEPTNIKTKKFLKSLIHFMGAWSRPLYHLVIELNATQNVPESVLSKANTIEENNRELLDDLRWILTKVFPTAKIKEKDPVWDYLSSLKSNDKMYKFLAMFNLSYCLRTDILHTVRHLRTLKCRITGKDC